MRYDYECGSCATVQEHSCLMAERPNVLPCPSCGGEARQVILCVPDSFVRFRPYEFNKAKNVRSNGHLFGRSDNQQHEAYRQAIDLQKKLLHADRRSGKHIKEDGFEFLGAMPGEMVDSISEHEGDKEAVVKDPVHFLKKTGLYTGRS